MIYILVAVVSGALGWYINEVRWSRWCVEQTKQMTASLERITGSKND